MTSEEFCNLQPGALIKLRAEIYSAADRQWDYYNLERFVIFLNHLPYGSPIPSDRTYIPDEVTNRDKALHNGKEFYCVGTFLIDGRIRTLKLALFQLEFI